MGTALIALEGFLANRRILYAVPTQEQVDQFWFEVKRALEPAIDAGHVVKNETRHLIEIPRTRIRIRAKTAWNSDTLRGDSCDLLILDEFQLMAEDAWGLVGAPMLLDNDGDAIFIYTPPSIKSMSMSKAKDKRHAAKLYKAAALDTSGRWATFHFTSRANPYLSTTALDEITGDMTVLAHRQEILAEDTEDVPGALWTHALLDETRIPEGATPALARIAVALDPSATSQETADEMGLVAGGCTAQGQGYVLRDVSMRGTPAACAKRAIRLYDALGADVMVAEVNNGGEWIGTVIQFVAVEMYRQGERQIRTVNYKMVHASRGKQTRAEPIAAEYEHHRVHHVGVFPELEEEMCLKADSMVATEYGLRRIDCIRAGDYVWSSQGLRRVRWVDCTSLSAEVCQLDMNNNMNLVATMCHPVYNKDLGIFVPIGSLTPGDTLEGWGCLVDGDGGHEALMAELGVWENMGHRLNGMDDCGLEIEKAITAMQRVICCILQYGERSMEIFPRDMKFITKMKILATMISTIWKSSQDPSIRRNIYEDVYWRVRLFAALDARQNGRKNNQFCLPAFNAHSYSYRPVHAQNIVQNDVEIKCIGVRKLPKREPVFNIEVEDAHDYYANGILVHNCTWVPGMASPNRMDSTVWLFSELLLGSRVPDDLTLSSALELTQAPLAARAAQGALLQQRWTVHGEEEDC